MGRADDLLTATLLTASCPVVFVPAMHTEMWLHPATQENVATLRRRGAVVLPPAVGPAHRPRLRPRPAARSRPTSPRWPSSSSQHGAAALAHDLTGRRVVISAGGTREPLDPVRYLGNRSSGKQGWALARVAAARGADVVLVAANVDLPAPFGVRVVPVGTAEELRTAMLAEAQEADVVVMAAAVADFRPETVAAAKLKKGSASEPSAVPLVRNPDVLAELVTKRAPGQLVVGFAAETGDDDADVLTHARAKLARKGCDLLVVNDVSGGPGLRPRGQRGRRPRAPTARSPRCPTAARTPSPPGSGPASRPSCPARRRPEQFPGHPHSRARISRYRSRTGHRPSAPRSSTDVDPGSTECHAVSSPPSRSPRATRTRSPTRSATRSWTRCSRRTRAAASPSRP